MNALMFFVFFAGAATSVADQSKILEGIEEPINIFNYPYVVYLQTDKTICSGSIIGATWVITTGSCLDGATQVTIRAGSANRLSGGSTHTGYVTLIHPQYVSGAYNYNFGLIMIWPPFPLGALGYSAIKIPWYNPLPGTISWVSGWGSTSCYGSMRTYFIAFNVTVITSQKCQSYYPDVIINPTIICTDNIRFLCGGAPLVRQSTGELYGMSIVTRSCGTDGAPALFVNVANQRHWIYNFTGI